MMSELESIDDVNDPNFPALLKKLMEELSEHIKRYAACARVLASVSD